MGTLTINPNLPELSAFFQAFPKVEIVTGLLIRRQFYPNIAAKPLGELLGEAFTAFGGSVTKHGMMLIHSSSHALRKVRRSGIPCQMLSLQESNFKEPTEYSPGTIHIRGLQQTSPPGTIHQASTPSLGRVLSNSSRFLENLSVAFLVDAEDFFANLWPTNERNSNVIPWENLRKLALTSRLLHPEIGRGKINKLLMAAGRAAAFMPKPEVMEIWNGGEGHACLFRYSNDAGEPKITWTSN